MRIDKFLKVSRILKRRTVAQEACGEDKVLINGKTAKPSAPVKIGDVVEVLYASGSLKFRVLNVKETVKKDEAAILALCEKYRFPLQTYSAAELNAVPGVFAHSDFVMKTVGCGCVCERAAVMTGGRLLVGKTAMQGVTLALAGEENI